MSAIVNRSTYAIEYPVGEWVKPKLGKIFIFQTLKDALEFICGWRDCYIIKKCYARGVSVGTSMCRYWENSDSIRSFWQDNNKKGVVEEKCPGGTIFADAIKILPD